MRILHIALLACISLAFISPAHADPDAAETRLIYEHLKLERDLALTLADRQPQSFWKTQAASSQRKLTHARSVFRELQLSRTPDYEIGVFQHDDITRLYQRFLQQADQSEPMQIRSELLAKTLDHITHGSLDDVLEAVACLTRNDLRLLLSSERPVDRQMVEASLPESIKKALDGTSAESCHPKDINQQMGRDAGLFNQSAPSDTFTIPNTLELH